ncbi:MAG: ECF-type sigma factor [Acidobacteriota bacterium]
MPDPFDGDPRALREAVEQGDVTLLLERWLDGQQDAEEPLLRLVYDELRRLAGRYLSRERPDHTLPPTGLVHEAYLRLVRSDLHAGTIENRVHFFAVAAQAMRRILVEHARGYQTLRRASPHLKTSLDERKDWDRVEPTAAEILAVDEALRRLRATHPRPARVAELRYFAGLTEHEIADALSISRSSVARDWRVARMMLRRSMTEREPPESARG